MPGFAVSLAEALQISRWEGEEPLKVELPPEANEPGRRELIEEPRKVELSPVALSWGRGASADTPADGLPESPLTPAPELPFGMQENTPGCLHESPLGPGLGLRFHAALPEAFTAGCLEESPLARALQLPFHTHLPEDFQTGFITESPLASSLQFPMPQHADLPDVPVLPLAGKDLDSCDAFQAWTPVYEAETATASPATSSGSDYDSNPEGENFYMTGFEHVRPWEPMAALPVESHCSLEDCTAGCLGESPSAPGLQLPVHTLLPEAQPPSRGSALHGSGHCRPCAWVYKPVGCQSGCDCDFCHLCPEGTLKAKKKSKLAMKRLKLMESSPEDGQPRCALSLASLI